jgi:hypothetical protein
MKREQQVGGRASVIVLALLATACTVVGHTKVRGWPELKVVEHHVPEAQMRDRCARYMGFGTSPQACTEFYLKLGQCHIWFSADFPPPRHVVEHERLHCRGYDHIGGSTMQALADRHLARGSASSTGATGAVQPIPIVRSHDPIHGKQVMRVE